MVKIYVLLFFIFIVDVCAIGSPEQLLGDAKKYGESGDYPRQAEMFYKAGMQYWEEGNSEKALDCFRNSVVVNQQIGNKNALLNLYTNIGTLLSDLNQLEDALLEFRKSLKIRQELGDKQQIISGMLNVASVLNTIGRHYETISEAEKALELAKVTNSEQYIRSCYGILAETYKAVGKNSKSMEYFNLYALFDKKIAKAEMQKKEIEAQTKVALAEKQANAIRSEKKRTEDALLQTEASLYKSELRSKNQQELIKRKTNELREQEEQAREERLLKVIFASGLVIVLVFLLIIYGGYRKIAQKNAEILQQQAIIQKKNLDITNSLNYAKKIQRAMLLPQAMLSEYFPDSFIFFNPREEVSGDFYYFTSPQFLENGTICRECNDLIVSAVDCTGHGVPGAFMSMIGFNLLDQIIGSGVLEPNCILDKLHEGVHKALKQDLTENKDGMDMSLLRIKKKERIVEFAGAKNPVVYFQNGEMFTVKPCRFPIGGTYIRSRKQYEKHEIACPVETVFYVFSDGFQDQFGGSDGRKFMTKNFKDLLAKIHTKPMPEQKEILSETLSFWRGSRYRQIDDVLVIGFKF